MKDSYTDKEWLNNLKPATIDVSLEQIENEIILKEIELNGLRLIWKKERNEFNMRKIDFVLEELTVLKKVSSKVRYELGELK